MMMYLRLIGLNRGVSKGVGMTHEGCSRVTVLFSLAVPEFVPNFAHGSCAESLNYENSLDKNSDIE